MKYEAPSIMISVFSSENIITASGVSSNSVINDWKSGTVKLDGKDYVETNVVGFTL